MPISTGTIYRIICLPEPSIQYIGSTFNQLKQRWSKHKQHYREFNEGKRKQKCCLGIYPYFDTYGIENFKLIKIKDYQVYREHEKDTKHLRIYEQLWIAKTKNVNINNAFSIKRLSDRDYKIRNKQHIKKQNKEYNQRPEVKERQKEYGKKYREEHIEERKEYDKKYREEHIEELLERKKEYYQDNKNKLIQKQKEYYQDNKEQRKEYRKKLYQKNKEKLKEKIICSCGSKISNYSLNRHEQSQKHIKYVQSLN